MSAAEFPERTPATHAESAAASFILEELEAALSPQRQLAFLRMVHDPEKTHRAHFLIATGSSVGFDADRIPARYLRGILGTEGES